MRIKTAILLIAIILHSKKVFKATFFKVFMAIVRIKLGSLDIQELNNVCQTIKELAKKSGVNISGPIPLPTRKFKITTRKSPCGNGTATFDNFEMRVHKRIIDLPSNESVLHSIMKLPIPRSVNVKIEMKD